MRKTLTKLIMILIFVVLCGLSVIDVRTMQVPRTGSLLILAAGLLMLALGFLDPAAAVKGMLVMTAASLMIALTTGGLGGGDVKVFGALGLSTGIASGLEILMLSFLISGIMAVLKPGGLKGETPFLPYIASAFFVIMIA